MRTRRISSLRFRTMTIAIDSTGVFVNGARLTSPVIHPCAVPVFRIAPPSTVISPEAAVRESERPGFCYPQQLMAKRH